MKINKQIKNISKIFWKWMIQWLWYCTALKEWAFISQFNNPVLASCYWLLSIGWWLKTPYALNNTWGKWANKLVSGYVNIWDVVWWWRQADASYNGNCSNSAQSTWFTLISL
jgi:hypothetical protein